MKIISGTDPEVMKTDILELLEKSKVLEYRIDPPDRYDITTITDKKRVFLRDNKVNVSITVRIKDREYLEKMLREYVEKLFK